MIFSRISSRIRSWSPASDCTVYPAFIFRVTGRYRYPYNHALIYRYGTGTIELYINNIQVIFMCACFNYPVVSIIHINELMTMSKKVILSSTNLIKKYFFLFETNLFYKESNLWACFPNNISVQYSLPHIQKSTQKLYCSQ